MYYGFTGGFSKLGSKAFLMVLDPLNVSLGFAGMVDLRYGSFNRMGQCLLRVRTMAG